MTGAAGTGLEIEHTRKGDAVCGPPTAVVKEVGGLRGAGAGGRTGEVVAATDEAGIGSAGVVGGELGVFVGCALGGLGGGLVSRREDEEEEREEKGKSRRYLDDHKASTRRVGTSKVDARLVMRDVEAWNGRKSGSGEQASKKSGELHVASN